MRLVLVVMFLLVMLVPVRLSTASENGATPPFSQTLKWSIGGNYLSSHTPVPYKGGILAGNSLGRLTLTQGDTRLLNLEIDGSDIVSSPTVSGTYAYIGTKAGSMARIDLMFGNIDWTFQAKNAIYGKAIEDEGRLYFGCADESFYCLDARTGNKIFEYKTSSPIWSTPIIHKDMVIFGGDDNAIHCLNKLDGKNIWTVKGEGWFEAQPVLYKDFAVVGSLDKNIYCINILDGSIVWQIQLEGAIHGSGVMIGSNFIVADDTGTVYSIDIEVGMELWRKEGFGPVNWSLSTDGSHTYFVDLQKNFIGFDNTGEVIWRRKLTHAVRSSLFIKPGRIDMITTDGQFYAWEECAFAQILPTNRYLGVVNANDKNIRFPLTIITGRPDGHVMPLTQLSTPFEAGLRCKSIDVRSSGQTGDGPRMKFDFSMLANLTDPSFCEGRQYFVIVFRSSIPLLVDKGVYEEPSLGGYCFVKFELDIQNAKKNCETCNACFEVLVEPAGVPYFDRRKSVNFKIVVNSTDVTDHIINLEVALLNWLKFDKFSEMQKQGRAEFNLYFNCMDLPGGSDFSIPFKITCESCIDRDGSLAGWEDEVNIDFTTDPRLRIEMQPGLRDVKVNEESVLLDVPAEVYKGRTLVPIRFIAETFGCDVNWDQDSKKVTINRKGKTLIYWAYKNIAEFDGKTVQIDVGPIIKNGRTLVPLRSIAESLGAYVRWVPSTKSIIIDLEF